MASGSEAKGKKTEECIGSLKKGKVYVTFDMLWVALCNRASSRRF